MDNQNIISPRYRLPILIIIAILAGAVLFVILREQKIPKGEIKVKAPEIEAKKLPPKEARIYGELKNKASLIVQGMVITVNSQWNDDNTFIWTLAEIKIDKWLKNKGNKNTIVVKIPGGTVDDITQHHYPELVLNSGEEVMLFVTNNPYFSHLEQGMYEPKEHFNILGFEKGKLKIKDGKIEDLNLSPEELLNEVGSLPSDISAPEEIIF